MVFGAVRPCRIARFELPYHPIELARRLRHRVCWAVVLVGAIQGETKTGRFQQAAAMDAKSVPKGR